MRIPRHFTRFRIRLDAINNIPCVKLWDRGGKGRQHDHFDHFPREVVSPDHLHVVGGPAGFIVYIYHDVHDAFPLFPFTFRVWRAAFAVL